VRLSDVFLYLSIIEDPEFAQFSHLIIESNKKAPPITSPTRNVHKINQIMEGNLVEAINGTIIRVWALGYDFQEYA
jgi:hypothetical protein